MASKKSAIEMNKWIVSVGGDGGGDEIEHSQRKDSGGLRWLGGLAFWIAAAFWLVVLAERESGE